MTTTIWLARHGETPWAVEDRYNGLGDIPLTERGRAQAGRLAARLRGVPLSAVYCSSLKRCVETATLCAGPHGLVPIPRQALVEVNYGEWDGMLRQEITSGYPDLYAAWMADPATVLPPQGEPGLRALARASLALRQIVADHPGQAVLVVAHKAINRLVLCDVLGVPPQWYRARIGQLPCALNCIEWRDGEPMVTLLNDVSHYADGAT